MERLFIIGMLTFLGIGFVFIIYFMYNYYVQLL